MKVVLLAALFVLGASVAQAFPHITVTSSEVLQANPLQVRTTFDLDLVGPGSWCWFELVERGSWPPANGDTTRILGGSAPAGWSFLPSGDHRVLYNPSTQGQIICFGPGAHFSGFTIVTNNVSPCFHIIFETPLLGLDGSYSGDACLVEGATPSRPTSWGALKSTYR